MATSTKLSRTANSRYYGTWLRVRKLFQRHKHLTRVLALCLVIVSVFSVWKYSVASKELNELESKFLKQQDFQEFNEKIVSEPTRQIQNKLSAQTPSKADAIAEKDIEEPKSVVFYG